MKKLKFKLLSNNQIEIDEEVRYFTENDNLNFKIDNDIYKYNLRDDILIKTGKDIKLTIDAPNDIIYVTLLENNLEFNMSIDHVKITKNAGEIRLKYTIIGDDKMENELIIKY